MSGWKYTDPSGQSVFRTNPDGSGEFCFIEAIADWIEAGNTPDPSDIPDPNVPILAQLSALDAPFTPRRTREFMRASFENEAAKLALTPEAVPYGSDFAARVAAILAMNPAYQIVKQYDDAAIAARAQLIPPLP